MRWQRGSIHLGALRECITGTPSEGWGADWAAIGEHFGSPGLAWRDAIRTYGEASGVTGHGWRRTLHELAIDRTGVEPRGWRHAIYLLMLDCTGGVIPPPVEWRFILDDAPQQAHFRYRWIPGGVWFANGIWRA